MKEAPVRKKVYEQLKKEGYIGWSAPKVKYKETDIFGIFDGVFIKDSDIRWIQWTSGDSKGNLNARKKKIEKFFQEKNVFIPCEIWLWHNKKKEFVIEYL